MRRRRGNADQIFSLFHLWNMLPLFQADEEKTWPGIHRSDGLVVLGAIEVVLASTNPKSAYFSSGAKI